MSPSGGPNLAEEQRRAIGNLAAENKNLQLRGINISKVARQFHVTPKAARKWLLEGLKPDPNYSDLPRSGRPPKLQQLHKNSARRHARHRDTTSKISERLERLHGIVISRSSVARLLRSGRNPLKWRTITRGKVLSPANILKRLAFCQEHLDDDFSRYVFLDQFDDHPYHEKDGSATHAWQEEHAAPAGQLGRPWAFRMYAAVGYNFKSPLLFVAPSPPEGTKEHKSRETFTAQGYISMLKQLKTYLDARYPDGDYVLVQDHAPQHTAKASRKAIDLMGLPILTDFTAQSWDQNIIENVWGFREHLRGAKAKSTDGWYAAYRLAWSRVQPITINKLVAGMHARLERIIEAKGVWVSHH